LSVVGLFLVASWAGLWLALPFLARAIGIGLFAVAGAGRPVSVAAVRWPTREEGLSRLDRGTGIRHRPATALTDTLSSKDPIAQALWREQRERTLASIKRIRAGCRRRGWRFTIPGAACAGRGDAGGSPMSPPVTNARCGSPRRSTGTACWRRPTSGSMPGSPRRPIPANPR
jgi:hypothetical protein